MHSFEDAKIQAGKKATGVRPGRDVDVSNGEQHSQDEPPASTGKEPKTSKQGNSVHSGPNKKITDSVKDGPSVLQKRQLKMMLDHDSSRRAKEARPSRGARNVSKVPKEPLQPHDIPEGPWRKLGIDYFTFDGNSYVLICDYFSKFPFLYRAKTSFWSLRDRLIDLFSIEGYPDEIVSDNGPPFQNKEFAKFLSGLGIKHTTSSPGYPRSNGFIEHHIQTVKNMLSKSSNTRSFQEVLADLRTTRIGTGLPSPANITSWEEPDDKGAS